MEAATYVMPIRRSAGAVDGELTRYLSEIGRRCELIVVDGSDPAEFDAAHGAWSGLGHHVRPHAAIAVATARSGACSPASRSRVTNGS